MHRTAVIRPWYREPAPWLLMLGPAVVVVAGIVTAWLAVTSDDGLVAEDHYRRGLAINRVIARVEASATARLSAALVVSDGAVAVVVDRLHSEPPTLALSLRSPTRSGHDRSIELQRTGPGRYAGPMPDVSAGRWLISLETAEWRLRAETLLPAGGAVTLHP